MECSECEKKDTTLDQDNGTDSKCVCMCTVQRRVIVNNLCEFQQKKDLKID